MIIKQRISIFLLLVSCVTLISCKSSNDSNKNADTLLSQNTSSNKPQIEPNSTDIEKKNILGKWQVEFITKRPVIDKSPAQLIFLDNGKLAGSASCNNMISSYTIDTENDTLSITPGALTRKMCFGGLMKQEERFINQLPKVSYYKIKFDVLYLSDNKNNELFKATRVK
jgi:heat shock protein HslJ